MRQHKREVGNFQKILAAKDLFYWLARCNVQLRIFLRKIFASTKGNKYYYDDLKKKNYHYKIKKIYITQKS